MCGTMNNKWEVFGRGVRAGKRDESSGKYCYEYKKKKEGEEEEVEKENLS